MQSEIKPEIIRVIIPQNNKKILEDGNSCMEKRQGGVQHVVRDLVRGRHREILRRQPRRADKEKTLVSDCVPRQRREGAGRQGGDLQKDAGDGWKLYRGD